LPTDSSVRIMVFMNILMLDTQDGLLESLADAFMDAIEDARIQRVVSSERLIEQLKAEGDWELVVLDCVAGDGADSAELISSIRRVFQDIPILAVAEEGDVETARAAIDAGASDFMVRKGRLGERVSTLLNKIRPQLDLLSRNRKLTAQNKQLREAAPSATIVGKSPLVAEMLQRIQRVAAIPRPVLITGERGTGKELVARAIHEQSGRGDHPMIVVNCAALPDDLLESELFGYEKGAFTGAADRRLGKFELAEGGTLFLDEIGNMSLPFQQKILRVVEYGTFNRVGGSAEIEVKVRIIAATNVNLPEKMSSGEFMRDLYDRLSFEVIDVPPLRDRKGDIELLANHFLTSFMREIPSLRGKVLSKSAIDVLQKHPFQGNVRELKNIIERAAYRDVTNEITPVDIGMLPAPMEDLETGSFKDRVDHFQKNLVLEAMESCGGNQAAAARKLDLSYHQFRYYFRKYSGEDE